MPTPPDTNYPSGELYQAIFENAADAILLLEGDTFFDCNVAALQMFGLQHRDEIFGMALADISPSFQVTGQESGPEGRLHIQTAYQKGSHRFEWLHRRKNGEDFPAEVLITRIQTGERVILQTTVRDLSEHRQMVERLHLERSYFRALVMNNPAAIVSMDVQGTILSWNPAAEKLFGYHLDEVKGKKLDALISDEQTRQEAAHFTSVANAGEMVHAITHRRRKDGTMIDVEVYALPVTVPGSEISAFAIYHDIRELQRARQDAESANNAKSAFLAMMSHEIRTPMNGIIGMTSLLLDTQLDDDQKEYAETIRNSADALLVIINDILDFSKIEAGKLELDEQPFDLAECVESALDLVAPRAYEKGLDLAYQIESQAPLAVIGDVTRLRQILLNLLSNAVKFTEKGEVVVSVAAERVSPAADKGQEAERYRLHFTVQDTGIGIPVERLDRLFKSFSQVDTSTTRRYGGTGLGLAISKRLSEMMNGDMWVESQMGKGSAFHFTILTEVAPALLRQYLHSHQAQLENKRLLIVDDNLTNLRILATQARAWGMLPRETTSPREALGWVQRGDPFDVALLDMQMPEMDGLTLAQEIAHYRDSQELSLVMLSSLGRREVGAADVDFAAYLSKPVKLSSLHNTLIEIVARQVPSARSRPVQTTTILDSGLGQRHPLHILLVEDHPVNQRLAQQMLHKLGYRPDLAGNGIEALQALERQPYDVVLMDVQMPEMDGLEASRRINRQWPPSIRPRIIAMTAEAMDGDRERCLAAGMDDYLAKPVRIDALIQALEHCQPLAKTTLPPGSHQVAPESTPIIDWEVIDALAMLQDEGSTNFVHEIIDLFLRESPTLIAKIRQAIIQGQAEDLRRTAHTLKGNCTSLGAKRLGELCLELEKAGREARLQDAAALLSQISDEFERTQQAFQQYRGTEGTDA